MEERQAVAEKWNVEFGGSHTAGRHRLRRLHARGPPRAVLRERLRDPQLRPAQKGVATCAECADYGCEKLTAFLANVPEAKANLEARRLS